MSANESRVRIGWIGLGNLGTAIAERLIHEGVALTVWNRTREKAASLAAQWADSPRVLAEQSDLIFLNLFDSAAVRAVLTGPDGILRGPVEGKVVVDTTTNHFSEVLEFHDLVRARGGSYLEAPVLGSVIPASQGMLTVLVSGDDEAYDRSLEIFRKFGKAIFFLGEPGLASRMKLVNNLVLASFMTTLAEALALGERSGLGRDQIVEILSGGAGNSGVLNAKKEKLLRGDFSPHFSCDAIQKDLRYLDDLSRHLGVPLTMGPAASGVFSEALAAGLGQQDFSSVYKVLNDRPQAQHFDTI